MRIHLDSVKRIGRKIGLNDDKGYAVAVFFALIVVAATVLGFYIYYVVIHPEPEAYNTIYLLDTQNQAISYPETLVANQNSTFSLYVGVENHLNHEQTYRVETKITGILPATFSDGLPVDPINAYTFTLPNGETHQNLVTITENNEGSYVVVFELWQLDPSSGIYVFTNNYCVLNVKVIK